MDGLVKTTERQEAEEEFSFKSYFVPLTTTKAVTWIIIIGVIVYFNCLFNGFVADDDSQIVQNAVIHNLSNLYTTFIGSAFYDGGSLFLTNNYRPLMIAVFTILFNTFGSGAWSFHLLQMILFIFNACLVFLFLKQFFHKSLAFVMSLIFLVHPMNNEVALYISNIQDVLYFFFGMLAMVILVYFRSMKAQIFASICLLLSLFSKETGVLFLLISLIYIFKFKNRYFYPFFGLVLLVLSIYFMFRLHAIGLYVHMFPNAPINNLPIGYRMINVPAMFWFYIKTFFYPFDIASSYQWIYTKIDFIHFILPLTLDFVFLTIITYFGHQLHKKLPRTNFNLFVFFALWYFIGILFHLQIIPLDQTVAVRWFYFSTVGITGMISVLIESYHIKLENKWILITFITIISLSSLLTFVRVFNWRDENTLVNHDIALTENNFDLENRIAILYLKKGQYTDALIHARKSVELFPNVNNYNTLGLTYLQMGYYQKSKETYLKSLHYGDYFANYNNIALLAVIMRNDPDLNAHFIQQSIHKFPNDQKLWMFLAIYDYENNSTDSAKTTITRAYNLSNDPLTSDVYNKIFNGLPLGMKFAPPKQ